MFMRPPELGNCAQARRRLEMLVLEAGAFLAAVNLILGLVPMALSASLLILAAVSLRMIRLSNDQPAIADWRIYLAFIGLAAVLISAAVIPFAGFPGGPVALGFLAMSQAYPVWRSSPGN